MALANNAIGMVERQPAPLASRARTPGDDRSVSRRIVVVAGGEEDLRQRLRDRLRELRWTVHDASGGAAAMACLEDLQPDALLLAGSLPDLEVEEFADWVRALHPGTDLLRIHEAPSAAGAHSPRRQELLQALRELEDPSPARRSGTGGVEGSQATAPAASSSVFASAVDPFLTPGTRSGAREASQGSASPDSYLPEMVGTSAAMKELGKLVRLVAPRSTTVLIEGDTGTGKELVAKALHRLSSRANKPFMVLNCAAIPEALLEAELFGHTRGAFTGAVRSRVGRIEAADGGTMFLDEIGEMPLALQAKMLRFLECGELQRVGDNEPSYVDVRVIAATHQPLEQRAEEQTFRLDLYHRLAVFPIEVPTLADRLEDLPLLAEHFLLVHGRGLAHKQISPDAMDRLRAHHWPGNVRELMHVLERALILAGTNQTISAEDIRIRRRDRSRSTIEP